MNPKTVIANIEKTRTVMEAQLKELREFPPRPVKPATVTGNAGTDAAELLAASLSAQLATAAEWLRALSDVEARVRGAESTSGSPVREGPVIDAEYREEKP